MYFITTKRMLEVCFFQHTPTFIIEPDKIKAKHVILSILISSKISVFKSGIFNAFYHNKQKQREFWNENVRSSLGIWRTAYEEKWETICQKKDSRT